jgi:hypothetical protein
VGKTFLKKTFGRRAGLRLIYKTSLMLPLFYFLFNEILKMLNKNIIFDIKICDEKN